MYEGGNMNKFILMTDSCSDLSNKQCKQMGLSVIPLSVDIEGTSYFHYPDERELKIKNFYQQLRDKKVAKTSLINVGEFMKFFEQILKKGHDILYIGFSSALSGTLQSAQVAAQELKVDYPESNIIVVDSLSASSGLGLLVWHAWKLKEAGKTMEEIKTWAEENRLNLCQIFTVADLGTLKRGGRLSDTQALLGTLLKVKPILHVSDEGKLVPLKKARGREFSFKSMVALMDGNIKDATNQTIFISHGDCLSEAKDVGSMIKEKYGVKDIVYNEIGPIIGAHSGPGTIAVFYVGNKR